MRVSGTWIGLVILGVSIGSSFTSVAQETTEADPALIARLHQADIESSLEDMRLKPWHMKLTFQLFDAKGSSTETGTIEEWWTNSWLYKIDYTSPSYTSTEIMNKDGFFRTKGAGNPPEKIQALRRQVVHPMPDPQAINRSTPDLITHKFGNVSLDCIMIAFPIKNLPKPPLGLYPTYCMEPGKTSLRLSFTSGSLLLVRNKMGRFQGREVAVEQYISVNDVRASIAHVETLETMEAQDTSLTPLPEMEMVPDKPQLSKLT